MSLPDGHTTIYCVYFGSDDNILCLPLTDSGQGTGSGGSFDRCPGLDHLRGGAQVDSVPSFDALPDGSTAGTGQRTAHALQRTRPRWTDGQGDSRTAHTGRTGPHRGRHGQRAGQAAEVDREQRQTVTEGDRTRPRFDPGNGCGRAKESPWTAWKRSQGHRVAGRITTGNLATVEAVAAGRVDCTESAPRPPYHSPR
jgi:hypothetical protein